MKLSVIVKILAALAAIAGAVYVIATYGDKIVAWTKKLLGKCECLCGCDCDCDCDCQCNADCDDCPCEDDCDECPCCQCDCEEVMEAAEEDAPVSADEADFEG